MIQAKEIDGELWIKATDHHQAIKAALEAKDEPLAYLPPTASPENACYNPPQRKPLTDMDIAIIDWESLVTRKDCVRAIEAAHGIKGEA